MNTGFLIDTLAFKAILSLLDAAADRILELESDGKRRDLDRLADAIAEYPNASAASPSGGAELALEGDDEASAMLALRERYQAAAAVVWQLHHRRVVEGECDCPVCERWAIDSGFAGRHDTPAPAPAPSRTFEEIRDDLHARSGGDPFKLMDILRGDL